jgi:outer membrane protein assembly factor BamB
VTGIRTDWSGGLIRRWEVDYLCQGNRSVCWSAPSVRGNRLVVPGRAPGRDLVFCLDPASGQLLWLGELEAEARRSHGSGARATPALTGEHAVTFGRSGDLACWRLQDGELLWHRRVEELGGEEPTWGHAASPVVLGEHVILQAGGSVRTLAVSLATGEPRWTSGTGIAGYATPVPLELGELPAILVFHGTGLAALARADGRELWNVPWTTDHDVNATTPVVAGDTVFITSGYGAGCQALRMTAAAAEVLWRSEVIASHHSDPVLVGGVLYGYSGQSSQNRGDLVAVELATGEEHWRTGEVGWGTCVLVDGHLLCLDIEGNLYLVAVDPDHFRLVATLPEALGPVRDPAWTSPVVAGGRLYLRYLQRLICYDLLAE